MQTKSFNFLFSVFLRNAKILKQSSVIADDEENEYKYIIILYAVESRGQTFC